MSQAPDVKPLADSNAAEPSQREVRYEFSRNLASVLDTIGTSLVISTYQAGKLVVVGVSGGELRISFHNFDRPMGVAVSRDRIAVGTRDQVWYLRSAPDIARQLEPPGSFDACFLTRQSYYTGDIESHEMGWCSGGLVLVNTLFSCLCRPRDDYSFEPIWRPAYITALASEDRCHLNGLACEDGQPRYVTALAETDTPAGWRPVKTMAGCLIDIDTHRVIARGFPMPHSPRLHYGRLWMLDSGNGRLVTVTPSSGEVTPATELPGYARGLSFFGPLAFVGLSKIRETATFGGMPIEAKRTSLKCGVGVIEWATGRLVAHLEFVTGVEEIFAVEALPGIRNPYLSGPNPQTDNAKTIWTVPLPPPASS